MRHSFLTALLVLPLLALSACDAAAPEDAALAQAKAPVCHYDEATGTYERLDLPTRARDAHLRHGDGFPGGAVEGAYIPSTFDDSCAVVPDGPFVCTVEYDVSEAGLPVLTLSTRITDPSLGFVDQIIEGSPRGADGVSGTERTRDTFLLSDEGQIVGLTATYTAIDPVASLDDSAYITLVEVEADLESTCTAPIHPPDPG